MAIKMTPSRRSKLVEMLMKQNEEQWAQNPQTGWETGLKLMAQAIRQGQSNKLQETEAAATKTRGANEAAALAEALGQQPKSVFGTELPGEQAPGSMRQHLMTQNPESGYGPVLAQHALKQAAAKKGPESPWSKINPKDYTQESVDRFEASFAMGRPDYGLLKAKPKEPLVNISNASPDRLREPQMIEYLTKYAQEAEGSYAAVRAADNALGAIEDGIFAGLGKGAAEQGARVLSLFADKDNPPEAIGEALATLENSQFYDSQGGVLVGQIIRLFGSGTGLSDADREYAQKIAGALRDMEIPALKRILQEVKKAKFGEVSSWNRRVDKITAQDPEFGSVWKVGDDFEAQVLKLLEE